MQGSQTSLTLYPRQPGSTIYTMIAKLVHKTALLASVSTIYAVDYDLMHRRMGHLSRDVLRQATRHTENFPKEIQFPVGPSNQLICRGCAEGKMHLQPFVDSVSRASRSFELIHSDLKELPTVSYHKYKYFVTFLDDYSSHCWVVLLKQKSDSLCAIDDFLALVWTQHNALVKQFMTDAGGEYKNFNLSNKFKELGISHRMSVPHMHQQNGCAERLNRTLIEKAQALRFEACLPQSYWKFSVEFAVHVYNRTPVKHIAWCTPFEVLNGTRPDISHLRVFGCGADVRVNKLAPRAEVMIFLGYTSGTKGFKFMRKPNNVIFHGVTAVFDEHMFPSCPDNISPGSTHIGANYPDTEFDIPLEDRGWFDGGAVERA